MEKRPHYLPGFDLSVTFNRDAMTPPRRRWFQFSLATMFVVVTVFAVLLGWELKFIEQRDEFREWLLNSRGDFRFRGNTPQSVTDDIPIWRAWLGDTSCSLIMLGHNPTPAQLEKAHKLFPEAEVRPRYSKDGREIPGPPVF